MAQIYKIYMNQSLLIMADFAPYTDKNVQTIGKQDLDLEKLFNSIGKNTPVTYLFVHPDIKKIIKTLLSRLKIIKAAGGLVKNGKGEYLFIHRLGKWDLPKGKIEENEKMSEGAVREVEEECGIRVDYLGKKNNNNISYLLYGWQICPQGNRMVRYGRQQIAQIDTTNFRRYYRSHLAKKERHP
jgi:hypothetical protein